MLLTIHKGPKGKSTTRQDSHVSCILKRIFNYFTFERYVKVLLVKFFVFIMLMDNIGHDKLVSFARKKNLCTTYDTHNRVLISP